MARDVASASNTGGGLPTTRVALGGATARCATADEESSSEDTGDDGADAEAAGGAGGNGAADGDSADEGGLLLPVYPPRSDIDPPDAVAGRLRGQLQGISQGTARQTNANTLNMEPGPS